MTAKEIFQLHGTLMYRVVLSWTGVSDTVIRTIVLCTDTPWIIVCTADRIHWSAHVIGLGLSDDPSDKMLVRSQKA